MRGHIVTQELGLVIDFEIPSFTGDQAEAQADIEPVVAGAVSYGLTPHKDHPSRY
jgi:hypothetical protein